MYIVFDKYKFWLLKKDNRIHKNAYTVIALKGTKTPPNKFKK